MSDQLELPEPSPEKAFDGETYDPDRDYVRLKGVLAAVFDFMSEGGWHTLQEIRLALERRTRRHHREQTVSARLRDLRKDRYGAHDVQRKRIKGGLFEYRLVPNAQRRMDLDW